MVLTEVYIFYKIIPCPHQGCIFLIPPSVLGVDREGGGNQNFTQQGREIKKSEMKKFDRKEKEEKSDIQDNKRITRKREENLIQFEFSSSKPANKGKEFNFV